MIKLRVLRWGDNPGLFGWTQCHHMVPYKWEAEGVKAREKGHVMLEAVTGVKMKDGLMNQGI